MDLHAYMRALAERLRRVRVCCGDWSRVVTSGVLSHGSSVGVFLDPPYDRSLRDSDCYATDSDGLSAKAREWAIEHSEDPRYRIALCGYEGEHEMPDSWRVIAWKTPGGYAAGRGKRGEANRSRERIWLSPACLDVNEAVPVRRSTEQQPPTPDE